MAPPDGGSGEQFVREQFPRELKAHRSRHGNVLLIVCVDQDRSRQDRAKELADACAAQAVPLASKNDWLLMLIPVRNIETWLYLVEQAGSVDEVADYKPRLPRCEARQARPTDGQRLPCPGPDPIAAAGARGLAPALRLRRAGLYGPLLHSACAGPHRRDRNYTATTRDQMDVVR